MKSTFAIPGVVSGNRVSKAGETGSYDDLLNKPAVDGVVLDENTTKEDLGLTTLFSYKGSVETFADLPTEGNHQGDVWNVIETGANYAWDGTNWDKLSETIDLTPYLTKDEAEQVYATQEALQEVVEHVPQKTEVEVEGEIVETIQVNNKDTFSSKDTSGDYQNIARITDQDVIDLASSELQTNINSKDKVITVNNEDVLLTDKLLQQALVAGNTVRVTKIEVTDVATGLTKNAYRLDTDSYIHDQAVAASTWTITHNLNKFPSIFIVDSAGSVVTGEVKYNNLNSVSVNFNAPFSGKAYLN